MNIAVCVKQIPDPAVPGKLQADHTLERAGKLMASRLGSACSQASRQAISSSRCRTRLS